MSPTRTPWICPRCEQRDDPRFHECPAQGIGDEPDQPLIADQSPDATAPTAKYRPGSQGATPASPSEPGA